MKKTKVEDQFKIDVDGAISAYNKENPEQKLNREKLAKHLGLTYQSLMNYQSGKIPNIIGILVKISDKTGVNVESLIKKK